MDANLAAQAAAGAGPELWSQVWPAMLSAGAAVAGTLAFLRTSRDFLTEPRQQRLAIYRQLAEEFEKPTMRKVRVIIASGSDSSVRELTITEKTDYCAFFEQLALVVYSRLLKAETAHYMYGDYVRRCYQRDAFWDEQCPRGDYYWSLFETFARDMIRLGEKRTRAFESNRDTRLGV